MFAPFMVRLSLRKPSVVSLGQRPARLVLLVQGAASEKVAKWGKYGKCTDDPSGPVYGLPEL